MVFLVITCIQDFDIVTKHMMKEIFMKLKSLMIGLLILVVFITGCSKSDKADGPVTFLLGSQDNPDSVTGKGITAMVEELELLSGGTMVIEPYFSSQLGDYKAMSGQVSSGEIHMLTAGYPDMSFIIPAFEVMGEPYVITSYDQLLRAVDSDFAQVLHNELSEKKNIQFMDVWYTGARQVTSNKPLNSIEDFKGLKIRTPNVPFLMHFAEAAGAVPSPIAFQEVYLALQTNQVEAQENPLTTINSMKFYEVQNYVAMTNHFIASAGIFVNTQKLESLSDQQRGWLEQAIAKGREVNNNMALDDEDRLVSFFQDQGLTITEPDLEPFKKAMSPFYNNLNIKYSNYGENIIEDLQALQ